jgi:serine/threonine protein kinase
MAPRRDRDAVTPGRLPAVEYSTLSLGRRLGQGGQGTVYEVSNKKINEAADDGGWDVAYKEYATTLRPDLDTAALASQVGLLGELSAAEGRWLCDRTAWPAVVVERGGSASGFLMRSVPDQYQFILQSLAGTSTGTKRLANLEYLLNDDTYVAGIGLTISERDRLLLLADLAATLTRLHRIGITVGDLSPKNLLFTTAPQPKCFLIDCDAMRLRGDTVLPQAETPDWQIPAGEEKATRASDVYKLALLAIRLFARDQTATDPTALTPTSPALADLARAGLNPDPARRPAPAVWAEQLTATATTASTTPAAAAPRRKQKQHHSYASSTGPAVGGGTGTAHGPAGNPVTVTPLAQKALAAVIAVVVIVALFVAAQSDTDSSSASNSPPQPTVSQDDTYSPSTDPEYDTSGSEGDSDSGGVDIDPSTTPPSEEDEAFSDVSLDDCLSNYNDEDSDWIPSTPTTTSCSDTDAYFYVESIEEDGDCPSDGMSWYHSNNDGTDTELCLDRNYAVGQCVFAEAEGQSLSAYFTAVTPCDAGIPDEYEYIVQLTKVYLGGAPDDACGYDRIWTTDDGAALCGKAIFKRPDLPDM